MAYTGVIFQNSLSPSLYSSSICCRNHPLFYLNPSHFISSKLCSSIRIKQLNNSRIHSSPIVCAAESNFLRVIRTVWKVGKDGTEAGTNVVPDAIPRPRARISVTFVAVTLALFVLKSFLSTAFFALTVIGLSYCTFIALNKNDGTRGGGGTITTTTTTTCVEDSLEEARRIMDKYK